MTWNVEKWPIQCGSFILIIITNFSPSYLVIQPVTFQHFTFNILHETKSIRTRLAYEKMSIVTDLWSPGDWYDVTTHASLCTEKVLYSRYCAKRLSKTKRFQSTSFSGYLHAPHHNNVSYLLATNSLGDPVFNILGIKLTIAVQSKWESKFV